MMILTMRKPLFVLGAMLLGLLGLGVGSAQAEPTSAWATLFDAFQLPLASSLNGPTSPTTNGYIPPTTPGTIQGPFPAGASNVIQQEVPGPTGSLGSIDMHFEYIDRTPLAPGASATVNFNIFEQNGTLSDTLGITATGHTPPGGGDNSNMSIDLHFRSENEGGIPLPPLANGISLTEIVGYQDVSSFISAATGLSDLHVRYDSTSVPEPASLTLFSLGGLCLAGLGWRKRKGAMGQS